MSTGSFIEMFMTTFGWHLYEIVWGVISSTGLAYLPFFAVIIDNVVSPIESQEAKSAASTSLRRLEIDVIRLIVMMILAVSPYMTIQYGAVSYTNACETRTGNSGNKVNAGNSGTVFDEVFTPNLINNQEAKAPPWFYIVMSVSGGINDAVIVRLPCEVSMRQVQYELSTMNITDPHLKRQTQRFITECYKPGVADFYNNRRNLPESYEVNDLDWPGSGFLNSSFYRNEYAKHPVPGFDFNPSRQSDRAYTTASGNNIDPEYGFPSCHEWWNDSSKGIRAGLVEEFPRSFWTYPIAWGSENIRETQDAAIREMIKNEGKPLYDGLDIAGGGPDLNMDNDLMDLWGDGIGLVIGSAGLLLTEALIQPILFAVKSMAPYIQATMLMATYFLLPWVLLVGNYSWSTVKTSTTTIFAMKFWTSIWAVIEFLDNSLQKVILEASGKDGLSGFLDHQNWMLDSIVDIMVLALYLGLPFYFLSMLGWGGERGASAPTATATGVSSGAQSAGSQGTNMAKSAITKQ